MITLKEYLKKNEIKISNVASEMGIPLSTLDNQSKKPLEKQQIKVITAISKLQNKDPETVTKDIFDNINNNSDVLLETNPRELTIMGVKFPTSKDYWTARDGILNSMYEGYQPTVQEIEFMRDNSKLSKKEFLKKYLKELDRLDE